MKKQKIYTLCELCDGTGTVPPGRVVCPPSLRQGGPCPAYDPTRYPHGVCLSEIGMTVGQLMALVKEHQERKPAAAKT